MKLTEHCYAVMGLGYLPPWTVNAGFVVGDHTTLVVDAGPHWQAAATVHGYAQAARPGNRIRVINTERHLDHMLGNCYFEDLGIPIAGHENVKRQEIDLSSEIDEYEPSITSEARRRAGEARLMFRRTRVCNPSETVTADQVWDLGGLQVNILMTPGHTPSNLSVFVPSDRVLFSGDCIVNGYLPNLDGGNADDWKTWLESLARLESRGAQKIVPGHGPVLVDSEVATEIERVRGILESAVRERRGAHA